MNAACSTHPWRRPTFGSRRGCGTLGADDGDCVEVAACPGKIHTRASEIAAGPTLRVASEGWTAFVEFAARG
ncbi:DUF397 domain-containing protein [Streptomyces sp. NPDC096176]|uniref:DUF397 domain-containing protein n=1 Tax=Streptomyces sp. NPDC096176 TaxID=3366079 RepID=UPI00383087E7